MVFAFSMGMLSPLVGKKEIASIIAIGCVLGAVGGAFFIFPVYEEVPYVAGTIEGLLSDNNEIINIDISSASNISAISSEILKQGGVSAVTIDGFDLRTDSFTKDQKTYIEKHLNSTNEFKSYSVNSGFINANFSKNVNSTSSLKSLVSWLSSDAGVKSEFAVIHLQVNVKSSHVSDVNRYLKTQDVSVGSIEGPVQDVAKEYKDNLLSEYSIIAITSAVGIIVSLAGIYVDDIHKILRKLGIIKSRNFKSRFNFKSKFKKD